jgi:transposase-like protein
MNTTSSNPAKPQVVTSVERRRRYTAEQKIEILNESLKISIEVRVTSLLCKQKGMAQEP